MISVIIKGYVFTFIGHCLISVTYPRYKKEGGVDGKGVGSLIWWVWMEVGNMVAKLISGFCTHLKIFVNQTFWHSNQGSKEIRQWQIN